MTNQERNSDRNWCFYLLTAIFSIYLVIYSISAIWLVFDGLANKFSSLFSVWNINPDIGFSTPIYLLLFTSLGGVLGGATLNIISFHKYFSVEKNFDIEYFWGFFLTPILSTIVGIIIFALVQGGLLVLSGSLENASESINSALGFTAIGCIAGYNWDVFIKKLQKLSKIINQQSE